MFRLNKDRTPLQETIQTSVAPNTLQPVEEEEWTGSDETETQVLEDKSPYNSFLGRNAPTTVGWHFSKPPREVQTTAIDWLTGQLEKGRPCNIGAPTGSGKSAIAYSTAESVSGVLLVPQKILQDQYQLTWNDISLLKGASNYPCKGAINCRVGGKHSKVEKCRQCSCPFTAAKQKFLSSKVALTNYACFFAQKQHDPGFNPMQHALVMDESHNLEKALIDSATLTMTEEMFIKVTKDSWKMPRTMDSALSMLRRFAASFAKEKVSGSPFWTEVEELCDLIGFVFEQLEEEGEDSWILCNDRESFRVCPVESDNLYARYIGNRWPILMSATPPPVPLLKNWLGEDYQNLELPSTFPIENRPVRFVPVAKLNKDTLAEPGTRDKLLKRVAAIMDNHRHEKGVIHTTTYALAQLVGERIRNPRLLIQEPGNREEILERHLRSKSPTILVSPSMTEGVDLYDDLGRFNIIMKVPYANLGDNWVRARKDRSPDWYPWAAMKDLVQAAGRTTRHEEDWSTTYILDGSFERLYNNSSHLFPKWFTDSVGS